MPQASVRLNEVGVSQVIPMDLRRYSHGVGIIVTILAASAEYSVQVTGDNLFEEGYRPVTGMWNAHDTLDHLTESANGNLEYPVTGVRLVIWDIAPAGFVQLSVVQAEG